MEECYTNLDVKFLIQERGLAKLDKIIDFKSFPLNLILDKLLTDKATKKKNYLGNARIQ